MLKEPTLKNVGLKQGHRISGATHLEIHLLFSWALYPQLKFLQAMS
ncbi:hypothetical protein NIES3585_42360 [Nodularia sp. NIES-3585]|nr:hypothetical protein NIES3585_42360 [Nodularia sp. NIES-3585]